LWGTTFGHFFLTSKPYFGLDNDNFLQLDFAIQSGRISYQPEDLGELTATSSFLQLSVFGGSQSLTVYPESWLTATAAFLELNVYGGGVSYDTGAEYMTATSRFSQLNVYGAGVSYDIEHHDMKATASFQTLTIY
jgi:hypothetical protein